MAGFDPQSKARTALSVLANLIWPPLSAISRRPVSAPGLLDSADWRAIQFLDRPWCEVCGIPFSYEQPAPSICTACLTRQPAYSRARASFVYDDHSRDLVLGLKHAGQTESVRSFGRWMARAGADCLSDADRLIPVPLHPSRLRARRFNQSLLLAKAISKETGISVDAHSLRRIKSTPSQAGLSEKGRQRNVAGVFNVPDHRAGHVAGLRLVLIDDVFTTGATLEACTRALKRAGADDVSVITLARVVKPANLIK